jgi:predicted RNase H-like HicB family nuclease
MRVRKTGSEMDYIAYLHKDRDSDFGVSFPDFPGCVTAGRTLEEARRMAAEALALHVAGMVEDGQAVPDPSNLDALGNDPNMRGAVAVLVSVGAAAEKTVRINITARQSQVEAIDQLAGRAGLTRSAYMVQSSLSQLASNIAKRERTAARPSSPAKVRKRKHSSKR